MNSATGRDPDLRGSGHDARSTAAGTPLRVVLVDDHAIVRHGLRAVLSREADLEVVGEAATPDEARAVIGHLHPDIVLLDLKLSTTHEAEGLVLCEQLTSAYPRIGVLVLTTFIDDALVLQAVRVGARGYVVKDVDTSALLRAIRDVGAGKSAFDAHSAAAMVRGLNAPTPSSDQLTEREREVLALLARGLSNRQIGSRLYVAETTAKFHVGNILRKLGVSRRTEAVYEASKRGVL